MKKYSNLLIVLVLVALSSLSSTGVAQDVHPKKNIENIVTITTPEGWTWQQHESEELPKGQRTYICKKTGSQSAITVKIFDQVFKEDEVEMLTRGTRTGLEKSMKAAGREITLTDVIKAGKPTSATWSFAGTIRIDDSLLKTKYLVLVAPKVITITCISPDASEYNSLVKIVEESQINK